LIFSFPARALYGRRGFLPLFGYQMMEEEKEYTSLPLPFQVKVKISIVDNPFFLFSPSIWTKTSDTSPSPSQRSPGSMTSRRSSFFFFPRGLAFVRMSGRLLSFYFPSPSRRRSTFKESLNHRLRFPFLILLLRRFRRYDDQQVASIPLLTGRVLGEMEKDRRHLLSLFFPSLFPPSLSRGLRRGAPFSLSPHGSRHGESLKDYVRSSNPPLFPFFPLFPLNRRRKRKRNRNHAAYSSLRSTARRESASNPGAPFFFPFPSCEKDEPSQRRTLLTLFLPRCRRCERRTGPDSLFFFFPFPLKDAGKLPQRLSSPLFPPSPPQPTSTRSRSWR